MSQPAPEQIWTVGQLLQWTTQFLTQKGFDSPQLDARLLLAHVLDCKAIDLYGLRFGETASDEVRKQYRELIQQRLEGCPTAYLIGKKEFFSLEFHVTPAVLIPQPSSETLVTECLSIAKSLSTPHILDLGTGSGNLAVTLAHHLSQAQITAVDISEAALAVAQQNAEKHGVTERIHFLHEDLFAPLPQGKMFDIIVSNPPYISQVEFDELEDEVRNHQPNLALDGGEDGFAIFDRIIAQAPSYLKTNGTLLLEVGYAQNEAARKRIEAQGGYQLHPTVRDRDGHLRVLKAVCL